MWLLRVVWRKNLFCFWKPGRRERKTKRKNKVFFQAPKKFFVFVPGKRPWMFGLGRVRKKKKKEFTLGQKGGKKKKTLAWKEKVFVSGKPREC